MGRLNVSHLTLPVYNKLLSLLRIYVGVDTGLLSLYKTIVLLQFTSDKVSWAYKTSDGSDGTVASFADQERQPIKTHVKGNRTHSASS